MKHYTSIEESKKLLELGLSPESADMSWRFDIENQVYCRDIAAYKDYSSPPNWIDNSVNPVLPCWSVGALLELMPKHLVIDSKQYAPVLYLVETYSITYRHFEEVTPVKLGSTPLEAVYNMVVWLLENNYIKTEK